MTQELIELVPSMETVLIKAEDKKKTSKQVKQHQETCYVFVHVTLSLYAKLLLNEC